MLKGWRTVAFNLAAAVLPVLQGAGADLGLEGNYLAIYGAVWAAANIFLRAVTNTPIGTK